MSDHLGFVFRPARGEYVRVGRPQERAIARDFLLEHAREEDVQVLLPRLEAWDWDGLPPAWLCVWATSEAYFVW